MMPLTCPTAQSIRLVLPLIILFAVTTVHAMDETDFARYAADFKHSLATAPPAVRRSRDPRVWAEFYQRTLIVMGNRVGKDTRIEGEVHFKRHAATSVQIVHCARDFVELRRAVNAFWPEILKHWSYWSTIVDLVNKLMKPLMQHDGKLLVALRGADVATAVRLNSMYETAYAKIGQLQVETFSRLRKLFEAFVSVAEQVLRATDPQGNDNEVVAQEFAKAQQSVLLLLQMALQFEGSVLEEFSHNTLSMHMEANRRFENELQAHS